MPGIDLHLVPPVRDSVRESGIHVLIVGLGIVGLTAAIECREKGHSVTAYEKSDVLRPVGDCVGLASNSARIIARWGNGSVRETLKPWVYTASVINIYNVKGKQILEQDVSSACKDTNYLIPRYQLLRAMYDYARQIGVTMHLGTDVHTVWETEEKAGVQIRGERVGADCVICCDGVHSRQREHVIGKPLKARPSGYAAFRALIDGEKVAQDPEARWIVEGAETEDRFEVFFASNAQMALQTSNKGREVTWFCIHKDSRELLDSWTSPVDPNDMQDLIKDWPVAEKLWPIIRHTPRSKFINYPLFDRDPVPNWTSQKGRIILTGDAAHPLSPAAGQGASQGMEDGNTVAVCLQIAGKDRVPLALRAAEKMRYLRASAIQLQSHRANDAWRTQDWDSFQGDDQNNARVLIEDWIYEHDSEAYAYAEFADAADAVEKGRQYIPTNVPADQTAQIPGEHVGQAS